MADDIAVDPDYYTLNEGYSPEDFNSETTSIASAISKGRIENGRRLDSAFTTSRSSYNEPRADTRP
ncbi:hypothetical protein N7481_007130 [Penicillium waksmanii]|uniref:uncharacterized protein n=1 Tax=Penicillium waksmanii TaxID=69791 RepID=UPI002547BB61|nr:uncharacterized protein N7481_007130 [Penicillium waksmanii]KAJ5979832.1 hypothetical protein N7481_007130 [Penicillium waksmanii]